MKTVLIVDDEILVRIGIRALLEGGMDNFEIVGEASGGKEGAALAEKLDPDIILADLVMAEGDGLSMIRAIRQSNKRAAIIVLSCHNDFEMLREAMRSGADDFVFKLTLKLKELLEAFSRSLAGKPERSMHDTVPGSGSKAAGASPHSGGLRDFSKIASTLFRGDTPSEYPQTIFAVPFRFLLLEYMPKGGDTAAIRLEKALVQLSRELARALNDGREKTTGPGSDSGTGSGTGSGSVREAIRNEAAGPVILESAVFGSSILLVLKNSGRAAAASVFEFAADYSGRYLGSLPRGGISAPLQDGEESKVPGSELSHKMARMQALTSGFAQAKSAATAAYRLGLPVVVADGEELRFTREPKTGTPLQGRQTEAGPIPFPSGVSQFSPEAYAALCLAVRRSVEALDAEKMRDALNAVLDYLSGVTDRDATRLASLALDAFTPFRERARACGFELDPEPENIPSMILSPESLVSDSRSLPDLAERMPSFIQAFIREMEMRTGLRKELLRVRKWVLSDLSRSYTVEEAASVAGMSPSHFSHCFKKETGQSFIDFVNGTKMERARELLLTTSLLVKEIVDLLGFESVNHFGNLFRRAFGVPPAEVRKRQGTIPDTATTLYD